MDPPSQKVGRVQVGFNKFCQGPESGDQGGNGAPDPTPTLHGTVMFKCQNVRLVSER